MKSRFQMVSILLQILVIAGTFSFRFGEASAVETALASKPNSMKKKAGKLETSHRFDATSLHGKFQTSPSTTATVEDDKFLEDLLGARKHFNDRIKKDSVRN